MLEGAESEIIFYVRIAEVKPTVVW